MIEARPAEPTRRGPGRLRLARAWPWLASLVGVGVVFWLHRDFGATMDEGVQDLYGRLCLRYFASGFRDQAYAHLLDLRFYGPAAEMLLVALQGPGRLSFTTRHLGLGLISVLTIPALATFCQPLGRNRVWAYAVVALWLSPQFLGHAFNNSKDLPFLVAWTAFMAALVQALVEPRATWPRFLWLGASAGLALAVRPGGMLLLAAFAVLGVALARILAVEWAKQPLRSWMPAVIRVAVAASLAWLLMVAAWPWAYGAPLRRPIAIALGAMRFPHRFPELFECQLHDSSRLPWYYLLKYVLIVSPPGHLLMAALAIPVFVTLRRRGDRAGELCLALALGWLLLPMLAFAVVRPTAYDGMRHFLFILPALALLVGFSLAELARWLTTRHRHGRAAALGVAALVLLPPLVEDVRYHPYESSAFNLFVGGLRGAADCYEVDYWASGLREATTWVARHGRAIPARRPVTMLLGVPGYYPLASTRLYAGRGVRVLPIADLPALSAAGVGIDYYVGIRRWGMLNAFADAETVYEVQRDGVALVVVRDLRGSPIGRRPAPGG